MHKPKSSRKGRTSDAEYLLLVGDWYHRTAEEALRYYMHPGSFGNEPVPDTILVNGAGVFNCSNAVPARPLDCKQRTVRDLQMLALARSQRNVLRVVNVGAYAGVQIALDDAALMPIAVDGETLKSAADQTELLPIEADTTIVLYAITQKLAHLDDEPRGSINHTTWKPQMSPLAPLISLSRDQWDDDQFVPYIGPKRKTLQWVDIVLNNLDEEGHPFHLHGHDFWVLSAYSSTFNWGSYTPWEDPEPPGGRYDLSGAPKKDTVYVPRRGYAVLRWRADNPGIWMFHCHLLWHQTSGMAMEVK